jgi:uncharacterized protein YaaQ
MKKSKPILVPDDMPRKAGGKMVMKLIITIIRDTDSDLVTQALTSANFRVTRVASTGGLLRKGMTTLLIGVEERQVEKTIQIVKENCTPSKVGEKRATIFVVPVEQFEQI